MLLLRLGVPFFTAPSVGHKETAAEKKAQRAKILGYVVASLWRMRLCYSLAALAGLLASCVAAEYVYQARVAFSENPLCDRAHCDRLGATPLTLGLKLLSTLLTLAVLILLACIYAFRVKLLELQGMLLPHQHFWETPFFTWTVLEGLMMALHCPVGCYANWTVLNVGNLHATYDADSIITIFQMVRLRPAVLLLLLTLSGFESMRTVVVSTRSGVKLDEEVAVRAIFKRHAIPATLSAYVFIVAVLSYCMHTAERIVCDSAEFVENGFCADSAMDLSYWLNCVWLIFVTSLTIGYGDLTPVTHLGRGVAVTGGLVGICLIAMLCNSVSSYMQMSDAELRATEALDRWSVMGERMALAREVMRGFLVYGVGKLRARREGRPASRRYVSALVAALQLWRRKKPQWNATFNFAHIGKVELMQNDVRSLVVRGGLGLWPASCVLITQPLHARAPKMAHLCIGLPSFPPPPLAGARQPAAAGYTGNKGALAAKGAAPSLLATMIYCRFSICIFALVFQRSSYSLASSLATAG